MYQQPQLQASFSGGREVELSPNSVEKAVALHKRVPPERWCVTIWDLQRFVDDVRRAWRRGQILDNNDSPNPTHHDKIYGPNMYQVNMHFIKPETLQAGGMSYALMKHPDGLACEVFVTHAWAEGVFEFADKVARAWPAGKRNLYCCLLANPQNLDISELLDVPPTRSPFAKALNNATHVLVVPNANVTIYDRLWCVYEAYLAYEWNKIFLLPAKPPRVARIKTHIQTAAIPFGLGACVGLVIAEILVNDEVEDDIQRASMQLFIRVILAVDLCFYVYDHIIFVIFRNILSSGPLPLLFRIGHILVMSCYAAACMMWLRLHAPEPLLFRLMHTSWMLAVGILSILTVLLDNENALQSYELEKQAKQLSFESVRNAKCSHPGDERRIRQAINGREDDVDKAIKVLMSAGAYTEELRKAQEAGLDIRGEGYIGSLSIVGGAILWLTVALTAANRALKWRDLATLAILASTTAVCFLTAVTVAVAVFIWKHKVPDRAVFALRIWSASAVVALVLTIVFLGIPGAVAKTSLDTMQVSLVACLHPPPVSVLDSAFLWPSLCATVSCALVAAGRVAVLQCLNTYILCCLVPNRCSSLGTCEDDSSDESSSDSPAEV